MAAFVDSTKEPDALLQLTRHYKQQGTERRSARRLCGTWARRRSMPSFCVGAMLSRVRSDWIGGFEASCPTSADGPGRPLSTHCGHSSLIRVGAGRPHPDECLLLGSATAAPSVRSWRKEHRIRLPFWGTWPPPLFHLPRDVPSLTPVVMPAGETRRHDPLEQRVRSRDPPGRPGAAVGRPGAESNRRGS